MTEHSQQALVEDALKYHTVIEVMVNPDGSLWIERIGDGRANMFTTLPANETERIIRLVASHIKTEVHETAPILSAELPESGERFEGSCHLWFRHLVLRSVSQLEQFLSFQTMSMRGSCHRVRRRHWLKR